MVRGSSLAASGRVNHAQATVDGAKRVSAYGSAAVLNDAHDQYLTRSTGMSVLPDTPT